MKIFDLNGIPLPAGAKAMFRAIDDAESDRAWRAARPLLLRDRILEALEDQGRGELDPRHIEGLIRHARQSLDIETPGKLRALVCVAIIGFDQHGADQAEVIAQQYGL